MNDFDKKKYWKIKALRLIRSRLGQLDMDFEDIRGSMLHIGVDLKPINEQIDKVYNDFGELMSRIQADTKKKVKKIKAGDKYAKK